VTQHRQLITDLPGRGIGDRKQAMTEANLVEKPTVHASDHIRTCASHQNQPPTPKSWLTVANSVLGYYRIAKSNKLLLYTCLSPILRKLPEFGQGPGANHEPDGRISVWIPSIRNTSLCMYETSNQPNVLTSVTFMRFKIRAFYG
jgi:hypothetical protein